MILGEEAKATYTKVACKKNKKSATKWNGGGVFDSTKKLQKKCESWVIFGGDLKISDRIHPIFSVEKL